MARRRSGGQAATHLRVGIYGVSGPDKPAPTTLLVEVNTQIATDIACNDFLFTLERREKLNVLVVDAGRNRQSFFLRQAYTSSRSFP